MWKIALSQVRQQPRRYISVLLAIVIGTTFLAAALLVGSSSTATLRNSLGATYSTADLVIAPGENSEGQYREDVSLDSLTGTSTDPGPLQEVEGVKDAYGYVFTAAGLERPTGMGGRGTWTETTDFTQVVALPEDPSLLPAGLVEGTLPEPGSKNQIALPQQVAQDYELTVGDTTVLQSGFTENTSGFRVTVTGLVQDQEGALNPGVILYGSDALVDTLEQAALDSSLADSGEGAPTPESMPRFVQHVLISLQDGADLGQTQERLEAAVAEAGLDATVLTPDDQVQQEVNRLAGSNVLVWVLLAFAAIALLVTAMVIANTFSVLVAQRSRELALQRALGASRGQVRSSVLLEAALVGVLGSVIGVLVALAVVAGLVAVGRGFEAFSFVSFGVDPVQMLLCVLIGTAITVVASMTAAAHATRVSPLEAMRPREDAALGNRAGIVRLVLGGLLVLGGGAAMVFGAFNEDLLIAVAGGALSFIGVLLLAVLFVPAAVGLVGRLARPAGVPGVMARLNALRNPGRTAATAAALLIGTTLVSMMLTGGRTAQDQLDESLSTAYPVDVTVMLYTLTTEESADSATSTPRTTHTPEQAEAARERVAALDGVDAVALLEPAGSLEDGQVVYAASPEALRSVVTGMPAGSVDRLGAPGTILVPEGFDQRTATVSGEAGSVTLEPLVSSANALAPVMSTEDVAPLGEAVAPPEDSSESWTSPVPSTLWVSLDDSVDAGGLADLQQEITTAAGTSQDNVSGSASERLLYSQIIDAMLLIVTALLAVSVLIALVGVANTLSLSTIERSRENSLMRALGLTRRGLRGMLALEAVLISGVAALLGCLLGTFYGWMGSQAVLAPITGDYGRDLVVPTIPWLELGVIILVAVVAGLLASVAPSRKAARLSPVQGLATV